MQNAIFKNLAVCNDEVAEEKAYWLEKLKGDLVKSYFPYDYLTNRQNRVTLNGETEWRIEGELFIKLEKLANSSEHNLFVILLTTLVGLLQRYTANSDLLVGMPLLKQKREGEFLNTFLAIRDLLTPEMTFKELLVQTKQNVIAANRHLRFPLEMLPDYLEMAADQDGFGLFDTALLLTNIHEQKYLRQLKINTLFVCLKDLNHLNLVIEYNLDRYHPETIGRIGAHFLNFLQNALADINTKLVDIEIFSDDEKAKLLQEFNQPSEAHPVAENFCQLFEKQVQQHPMRIAAVANEASLTYGELNDQANRLAERLREKGVQPDTVVGLMVENASLDLLVGLLGILKAGGAFLPIDPEYPLARKKYMLADSGALLLVTKRVYVSYRQKITNEILDLDEITAQGEPYPPNPKPSATGDHLAYIIYTSGTTGNPKGVMIANKGLCNYLAWFSREAAITAQDRTLLLSSFCFDLGYTSLFSSLANGGWLHLLSKSQYSSPDTVLKYIREQTITYLKLTPSLFSTLVNNYQFPAQGAYQSLRLIVLGGEKFNLNDARKFHQAYPQTVVFNHYGPTETTIGAVFQKINFQKVAAAEKVAAIGKPLANTQVYLLDEHLKPVPIGVTGEIFIAGFGLARGYVNHPELTEQKFLQVSFEGDTTRRVYRTGDLGRYLPDGRIQFLKRADHQVKIRGYRVETAEIETRLLELTGVKEAAVIAREDFAAETYLCAYLVTTEKIEPPELRRFLGERLPEYMIPTRFVMLEKMPLTPNGKLNQKKLPQPSRHNEADFVAPTNEVEEKLVAIWKKVLHLETVSIVDDFFAMGGHSLNAIMVVAQIHKHLQKKLSVIDVFQYPTIKQLAVYLKQMQPNIYLSIQPTARQEFYPLSSVQKRIYIMSQLEGTGVNYNAPRAILIKGKLAKEELNAFFQTLIARHESLRTSFVIEGGEPVQKIHEQVDFKVLNIKSSEERVKTDLEGFIRSFLLDTAPLIRVVLAKIAEEKHVLLLDIHHIISDGTSMTIFFEELQALMAGRELPPLKLHYKDFSQWQNEMLASRAMQAQEDYWLDLYQGELPHLSLPLDYERPATLSFVGATYEFALAEDQTTRLQKFALQNGTTLFMVLLAAYNILLAKYAGQEDLIVGTPIYGRPHADLKKIIGVFVNTLAIRNRPEGAKTVAQFLAEVKANTLQAFENQDYQFERLIEKLALKREPSRHPLVETMFTMQNFDLPQNQNGALTWEVFAVSDQQVKFDLLLGAREEGHTLHLGFNYSTKLFKERTIKRMAADYGGILASFMESTAITLQELQLASGYLSLQQENLGDFEFRF